MTLQASGAMRNRRECGQQQQKMEIEMRDRGKIIVVPDLVISEVGCTPIPPSYKRQCILYYYYYCLK